jgi:taurine ABC transporter substrate-binding protein
MKRCTGLVAAGLLLFMTACGNSGGAQQAKVTVNIGWVNVGASSNETLMFAEDLIRKQMPNAQVKMVEFTAGMLALSALQSGNIQIMTEVGLPPTAITIAKGVPLTIVWVNDIFLDGEGLAARDGSGISSLQDMRGKRVATLVGSSSGYMLHAALNSIGMSEKDMQLINMDPTAIQAAWSTKQIDAAYIWEPVLSKLANAGGKIIATNKNFRNLAASIDLTVVNNDFLKAHPDLVTDLIKAENQSIVEILTRPCRKWPIT